VNLAEAEIEGVIVTVEVLCSAVFVIFRFTVAVCFSLDLIGAFSKSF
jgi:hypothetical protein